MEFQLWWTGKTSFSYLEEGIKDYTQRINHFCKFSIKEFKGTKSLKNANQIQPLEEQELQSKLKTGDYIILLDENGKTMNSIQFSNQLEKFQNSGHQRIIFIIGGAFGFSQQFKLKANMQLSFSSFTMSHQLIRLCFMEQFYRAFTITHQLPYHNE